MDFDELILLLSFSYLVLIWLTMMRISSQLETMTIVRFLPESGGDAMAAAAPRLSDPGGGK